MKGGLKAWPFGPCPIRCRRIVWIGLLFLGVVAGGMWLARNLWTSDPTEDMSLVLAEAERRDIESDLLLTGEITPAFQVEVKAEVGGKVKQIFVEVGEAVLKGDVLAEIDDTDLLTEKASAETDILGAQLSVDKNRGNYERARALYEQKLISKEVFSNLEADLAISGNALDKSKSRLQSVEDRLRKTKIVAPADGTALEIPVKEGQVVVAAASVNAGTVLMTFANLSVLQIHSHVNQVDAPRLRKGQEVDVKMSDSSEDPIKAHINFIAPLAIVKNNIKGFKVEAVIDDNDGRLKPGMSVSMNVPVGRATQAISVPINAVFKDRDQDVVYVQKGDATERRKVTLGVNNLYFVEIKSGVDEGESILLAEPEAKPVKS